MIRDSKLSRSPDDRGGDDELDKALSSIQLIESLLGEDDKKALPENTICLPLSKVLALIPEQFRLEDAADRVRDKPIALVVDDLFAKLAKGRVYITLSQLVYGVPADLVKPEAYDATSTQVVLPLPDVVSAIDPKLLEEHTSQSYRRYNVAAMADPFAMPKPAAPVEVVGPAPVPAPEQPVEKPAAVAAEVAAPVEKLAEPEPPVTERPPVIEAQEPPPVAVEQPAAAAVVPPPEDVVIPAASVEPVASVEPESAAAPVEAAKPARPPRKKAEPVAESGEPDVEPEQIERLGGVNLNTAMVEQLLTLEGVSSAMARNIIAYRTANGPFRSIFHLCRVPGLGRKTFKYITGMPWSDRHLHRKRRLASLVGLQAKEVGHLPTVAQAIAKRVNFTGCVISDQDGLVLASSGAGDEGEAFGAVVPRLFYQIRETVKAAQVGDVESISLCFGSRMFTVAVSGKIFLTGIRQSNKLTIGQLEQFSRVAVELAWLLSHRGYVGRSS